MTRIMCSWPGWCRSCNCCRNFCWSIGRAPLYRTRIRSRRIPQAVLDRPSQQFLRRFQAPAAVIDPGSGACQRTLAVAKHRLQGLGRGATRCGSRGHGGLGVQGVLQGCRLNFDPPSQYFDGRCRQFIRCEVIQGTVRQMPAHEMAHQPVRLTEIETTFQHRHFGKIRRRRAALGKQRSPALRVECQETDHFAHQRRRWRPRPVQAYSTSRDNSPKACSIIGRSAP